MNYYFTIDYQFFLANFVMSINGDENITYLIETDIFDIHKYKIQKSQPSEIIFNWPIFHHDNSRSEYSEDKGTIVANYIEEEWEYWTNSINVSTLFNSSPFDDISDNGIIDVVIGSGDWNIYALRSTDIQGNNI